MVSIHRSLRVVVVDDYPDRVEALTAAIEVLGPYKVWPFGNASAALLRCTELKPELALVDIGFRDPIDGCEFSKRVQQLPLKTFRVAITGYT